MKPERRYYSKKLIQVWKPKEGNIKKWLDLIKTQGLLGGQVQVVPVFQGGVHIRRDRVACRRLFTQCFHHNTFN